MSMTFGPHLPKKGWLLRWTKLGAALVLRTPETVIIGLVVSFFMAYVVAFLAGILRDAGITGAHAAVLLGYPTGLLSTFFMLILTNRIMYADRGHARSLKEVWQIFRILVPSQLAIITLFSLVGLAVDALTPTPDAIANREVSGAGFDPSFGNFAFMIMGLGYAVLLTGVMPCVVLHPFTVPAMLGRDMTISELRTNGMVLSAKGHLTYMQLFMAVIMFPALIFFIPPIIHPLVVMVYLAWIYVGGREVVGGIDDNGEPQKRTSLKLAFGGAA